MIHLGLNQYLIRHLYTTFMLQGIIREVIESHKAHSLAELTTSSVVTPNVTRTRLRNSNALRGSTP